MLLLQIVDKRLAQIFHPGDKAARLAHSRSYRMFEAKLFRFIDTLRGVLSGTHLSSKSDFAKYNS